MPFIVDTLIEYITVGMMISSVSFFLCMLIYLLVYKKLMNGKKSLNYKKAIIFSVFVAYIYLVLNTTIFANFRDLINSGINLELFNAYKKVLYRFSNTVVWRDIILNIFMFIPFGFLLPLLNKSFYKPYVTLILSFLFTIGIENTQLIVKVGAYDVDDIFNNFSGSLIGYCLVMSILSSKLNKSTNKPKYFLLYFILLILLCVTFIGYYIYCYIN